MPCCYDRSESLIEKCKIQADKYTVNKYINIMGQSYHVRFAYHNFCVAHIKSPSPFDMAQKSFEILMNSRSYTCRFNTVYNPNGLLAIVKTSQ